MSETRETNEKRRGSRLWLLLIVALLVVVWYVGQERDDDQSAKRAVAADLDALGADPDDILVDLDDSADAADVAALEAEFAIDLVLVSDEADDEQLYRARVAPERRDALLAALEAKAIVDIAEPDAQVQLSPTEAFAAPAVDGAWADFPNDPKYQYQWHMDQIRMRQAWPLADGDGVTVAVIDTGVAHEDHEKFHLVEDLQGVEFVKPYDFVANRAHGNDDHGHGTHVAGTIAQSTHNGVGVAGIALKTKIMPLKVLSASGSGSVASIADAIHFAADEGAQVINMSLGGRFPSRILRKAVKYAYDKGVVVVCAAGNDGRGKVSYPAAYPGAFAVAATQYDETTTFYSNWGKEIAIAAPGGNTRVDQNGDGLPDGVLQNTITVGDPTHSDYYAFMGTSMASPHVAGVAALVVGEGVTDPAAVEKILRDSARTPSHGNTDAKRYGAGILDAEAAVKQARAGAGGWQLGLGLLMAGLIGFSVRKRGVGLGASYVGGAVFGASGLFFLPYILGGAASWPVVEMLSRGLPSWDLALLGPAGHGNPLFFSALIPLGLVATLAGSKRLRPLIAGLTVGVAGHLLFHAGVRLTDVQWVPDMLDSVWLAANAGLCGVLAHLTLRK